MPFRINKSSGKLTPNEATFGLNSQGLVQLSFLGTTYG